MGNACSDGCFGMCWPRVTETDTGEMALLALAPGPFPGRLGSKKVSQLRACKQACGSFRLKKSFSQSVLPLAAASRKELL